MRLDDTTNHALQNALKKIDTGLYSDLEIKCGNKQYQVHKAIICPRSSFFRSACRTDFREGQSNVIDLQEDDPEAVDSLIHYIYNGYYPKMDPRTQGISQDRLGAAGWKLETFGRIFPFQDLSVKISLSRSLCQDLSVKISLSRSLCQDLSVKISLSRSPYEIFTSLTDALYTGEFTGGLQVKFLVLHAKVYALAEKYEVSGLKEMAQRCFQIISNCGGCCSKEFAHACEFVYTTTIDSDRGLRDVVVQALHENPRALDEEHIQGAMRSQPDLPYDLVLYGRGKQMRKEKARRSRPSWMNGVEAS
ncbi:hypothetical protein FALBO_5593 [Fusarium albosuccineum]|uniref:BTB domain-containing protein n=1 Tax=Fusarium albosuccineum TaxID=1237068 RepID=A0A8H4LHD7_9HYPO|nr:hypothetical protein FALBO_5593 [Fusarium albosuccineum]